MAPKPLNEALVPPDARRGRADRPQAGGSPPASPIGMVCARHDRSRRLGRRAGPRRGGQPPGAARPRRAQRSTGIPHELVLVDDGSTDRSVEIIESWIARRRRRRCSSSCSRNFGMEVAMSAGIDHRTRRVRRADARRPAGPARARAGDAGQGPRRRRRGLRAAHRARREPGQAAARDGLLHADGAPGAHALPGAGGRLPADVAPRGASSCAAMPEHRRFLRGMVAWVGFDQVPIEYRRAGRHAGRGASYRALFRLAIEALASFSDVPLALATVAGTADRGAGGRRRRWRSPSRRSSAGSARAWACGRSSCCCSSAACSSSAWGSWGDTWLGCTSRRWAGRCTWWTGSPVLQAHQRTLQQPIAQRRRHKRRKHREHASSAKPWSGSFTTQAPCHR